MNLDVSWAMALLTGVAIAAVCGLRAFLPLLGLGAAARLGLVELKSGFEWLQGDHALWALGVAAALEIAADKIPVVDHALDAAGTLLRPAAAWLGGYAVLRGWASPLGEILAAAMGVGALAVHGIKAKLRLGSTVATIGHANPVLSIAEDTIAFGALILAFLAPWIAVILIAIVFVVVRNRMRPAASRP